MAWRIRDTEYITVVIIAVVYRDDDGDISVSADAQLYTRKW